MKALVAGIDPGTNTAVVVIDEYGNFVDKLSGKNISVEDIIKYISNIDNVVLISTDKKDIPKTILEISSKLNIGVYAPKKDIDLETKDIYYKNDYLKNILENNHEFDAYISAIESIKKLKDLFEKAKKVTNDEKEYIKILRLIFKKRKIEPFSAKYNIEKDNKDNKNIKNFKKNKIKRRRYIENINIIIEKTENKEKENLEEINKVYIKLLDDYNKISTILVNKINEKDNIVPKISFLYLNKLKSKRIFIDDLNEDYIRYYINKETNFFILEKNKDYIERYIKEYFIVEDFIDLKNFIIINKFKKEENKNIPKEDITIEKMKKILKDYRSHPSKNIFW